MWLFIYAVKYHFNRQKVIQIAMRVSKWMYHFFIIKISTTYKVTNFTQMLWRVYGLDLRNGFSITFTFTVPSSLPVQASCGPRRAGKHEFTKDVWPFRRFTRSPVSLSHTHTVLSVLAEKSILRKKESKQTCMSTRVRVYSQCPWCVFHTNTPSICVVMQLHHGSSVAFKRGIILTVSVYVP